MIKKGSKGLKVRSLQLALGLKVDGDFGNITSLAVKEFQKAHGLVPDGIVGKKTWNAITFSKIEGTTQGVANVYHDIVNPKPLGMLDKEPIIKAITSRFAPDSRDKLRTALSQIADIGSLMSLGLTTKTKMAYLMGQVFQEVGYRYHDTENLNYSVKGLINTFGYYRRNRADALRDGRSTSHSADQYKIASKAYGGKYGNDDYPSSDGWRYRGGGGIHLTFKHNHKLVDDFIKSRMENHNKYPSFVAHPQAKTQAENTILVAAVYWKQHNMDELVKHDHVSRAVCDKMTDRVNRFTHSRNARWANTKSFAKALGVRIV